MFGGIRHEFVEGCGSHGFLPPGNQLIEVGSVASPPQGVRFPEAGSVWSVKIVFQDKFMKGLGVPPEVRGRLAYLVRLSSQHVGTQHGLIVQHARAVWAR